MGSSTLICDTQPWNDLKVIKLSNFDSFLDKIALFGGWFGTLICGQAHLEDIKKTHLRELMNDAERCKSMMVYVEFNEVSN